MTTTKPTRPSASAPPTVGELLEDTLPLIETVYVAGPFAPAHVVTSSPAAIAA
jgi:hypothetical protein